MDYPLPARAGAGGGGDPGAAAVAAGHRRVGGAAGRGGAGARSGFAPGRTPCQSTLQRLFARLDADRLVDALSAHFQPPAAPDPAARGGPGGGDRRQGAARAAALPGAAAARSTRSPPSATSRAWCWPRSRSTARADKAEAELTRRPGAAGAPRLARAGADRRRALLPAPPLPPGAATAGGDYLLLVKENQPALYGDIALLFDPPATVPAAPLDRPPRGRDPGARPRADPRPAPPRRLHRPDRLCWLVGSSVRESRGPRPHPLPSCPISNSSNQ